MFQEITSKNNEQLKYLRKLSSKSFRDTEAAFTIEGTKLFLEAVKKQLLFKHVCKYDSIIVGDNITTKL